MNKKLGTNILTVAATLAVLGCLGVNQEPAASKNTNAERVAFIQATSASVLKAAAVTNELPTGNEAIKAAVDQLGCPKLSALVTDLMEFQGTEEEPLPESLLEYLECFGITVSPTLDDIDVVWAKMGNAKELLDCICGGPALSDAIARLGQTGYSAEFSAAATAYFQAAQSTAASEGYSAGSSTAASGGYSSNASSAAGGGYGD